MKIVRQIRQAITRRAQLGKDFMIASLEISQGMGVT